MIVCIAEDRRLHEPAVQAAIQSLLLHNPGLAIALFCPDPSGEFRVWLQKKPTVQLRQKSGAAQGWNIKPAVLIELLNEGHDQVIWLDSDIVVLDRLEAALPANDDGQCLVVAEEALWGMSRLNSGSKRTRDWGLRVGRELPQVLNSCVVRATAVHLPLLRGWESMLSDAKYLDAQKRRFSDRPAHLGGDQDVLTAALGSEAFATIPLHILRCGHDIIQFFGPYGFTTLDRAGVLAGHRPTFVHSQGSKPWLPLPEKPPLNNRLANRLMQLYAEASPYVLAAGRLDVEYVDGDQWLKPRTFWGWLLRVLGFGSLALTGLPVAMSFDAIRYSKAAVQKIRGR